MATTYCNQIFFCFLLRSLAEILNVKVRQLQPEEPEPTEIPFTGEPSEAPITGEFSESNAADGGVGKKEEEPRFFSRLLSERKKRKMKQILKQGRSSLWKLWKKSRGLN